MHYYFASGKDGTINIIREATEKEYLYLKERLDQINNMLLDKRRIDGFIKCYEKILKQYAKYTQGANIREVSEELNEDFAAYLGAFKKLTDNWQTAITRKYGKKSKEYEIFKKGFAEQYDQNMEYRIVYRLRNFDQHCGNIISKITVSMEEEKAVYKICMDRDYLLENFKEWKKEEIEYLLRCDEKIEILSLFRVFHQCVLNAFTNIMRIDINESLGRCCVEILNFINDISADDIVYIWIDETNMAEHLDVKENFHVDIICIDRKLYIDILKMYICLKQDIVKILYHGEKIRKTLFDCAIYVERDNIKSINLESPYWVINGKRYIRLLFHIDFTTGDFYSVCAEPTLKKADLDKLQGEFTEYLHTLLGK